MLIFTANNIRAEVSIAAQIAMKVYATTLGYDIVRVRILLTLKSHFHDIIQHCIKYRQNQSLT